MGINYFTDDQVEKLGSNVYVKHVSNKAITYTQSFKEYFYKEKCNGLTPTQIFKSAGFDIKTLGKDRITAFAARNKVYANRDQGFADIRKGNVGRPKTKDLTAEEQIEQLKQKNKILKQENDFLKRVRFINKKSILKNSLSNQQGKNTNL